MKTKIKTIQLETCSENCAENLKCDRNHGLIYGPFSIQHDDGHAEFVNSHIFAAWTGECTYCGGYIPENNRTQLAQKFNINLD